MKENSMISNNKLYIWGVMCIIYTLIIHLYANGHQGFFESIVTFIFILFFGFTNAIHWAIINFSDSKCFDLLKRGFDKEEIIKGKKNFSTIIIRIGIVNLLVTFVIPHGNGLEMGLSIFLISVVPVLLSVFDKETFENLQKYTDPIYSSVFESSSNLMEFQLAMLDIEKEKERMNKRIERRKAQREAREILISQGVVFDNAGKRPPIPRDVVDAVWIRDNGKCVYCGATEDLQLDHIIPFSKGGATTVENLQLLCQKCNIRKSNHIGNE